MWQEFLYWLRDLPGRIWGGFKNKMSRLGEALFDLSHQRWKTIGRVALVLLAIYYPVGMVITHKIDDNAEFSPPSAFSPAGGSRTVAAIAGLIEREVNGNGWVMNDPIFLPGWMLDNMPNFQQGMFSAFARVSIELRDQVGRTRGSSTIDKDLEEAAGLLPYPGDVWVFNFSTSWLPTASAERQYLSALTALNRYNARVASGEATFETRSDNLMATLDRIALDVGASSAAIDNHISEFSSDWMDFGSDDLFYSIKGQSYAYLMILKGLKQDFASVIQANDLNGPYEQMIASFEALSSLDPLIVANSELDGMLFPNHLVAQGFYVLRARTQLREITNILLK
jgi:hypothetical protein